MKKNPVIKNQSLASSAWLLLGLILMALTPAAQAVPQNLTWTTSNSSVTEGAGTWNQGSASLPSGAPWYNGSTYGNTMASGDNVTFGGGTAGTVGTITIGTGGVNPGNVTFNAPFNGSGGLGYFIGAAATPAVTMSGGTISINTITNTIFTAQLNGSFSLTNLNSTKGLLVLAANGTQTSANTVTVNPGSILQIGNNSSAGTVGSATITNNGVVSYRRSSTVTMANAISGTGSVVYQLRLATVALNTAGTYAGSTAFNYASANVGADAINWGVNNALPTNTALSISAGGGSPANSMTVDLKGFNQALGSLSGGDAVYTVFTSSSGAPTLTVSGTNAPATFSGVLSGSLALTKGNTNKLTLNAADTYTGNTTINGGTLALGASGSIANSAQLVIAAGGTFDVSAISAYTLGTTTTLKASGTTNASTINGNAAGTVDLGSQPIFLNYDGTNAALTIAQGQLLLNGNAFTVNKATPLAAGDYTIVTNLNSTISSNGSFTVSGTAISGTIGSLLVGGSSVVLHLVPAPINPTNSTVVASPTTLPADNTAASTVTVTLLDNSSNAISGIGVTWTVSGFGNTVMPASSGVTDGSGQTSFTVKSIKAETKTVIVSVGALSFTNAVTFTNPAVANVLTWDPAHNTTGSDGLGTWDTSTANWANNSTDVAWPNNGNDLAVFGTGGALASSATVTLAAPVLVGGLNFNYTSVSSSQYTISGANTITLSNTPTINVVANALISSPLTGSGFVKDGAGVLRIDGNATNFSGGITVSNGLLQIGNNGAGGNLGTGTITLVDPGVLGLRRGSGGSMILSNLIAGTTTGNVGFQLNQSSVVTLARANTYTAATTILQPTGSGTAGTLKLGIDNGLPPAAAFSIYNSGSSVQTFDLAGYNQTLGSLATLAGGTTANSIVTNSSASLSTLTVSGTATTTYSGALAGNIAIIKDGSGTLTVSTNSYTGNTTVKAGTLVLQQAALSTNSTVTVTNGTLQLDFGTVTNQVAAFILNGTNMAPGLYSAATESPYLSGTGSLLVVPVANINPNPPVLQVSASGSTLSLAWPTNKGWILQSNSVSLTTTGAWFNYPEDGSVTVTNVTIVVNPAKTNVFYRMLKP